MALSHLVYQAAALASGMMDKLEKPGHFTLFAPTNEAFDKLGPDFLERVMGDKTVIAGDMINLLCLGCFTKQQYKFNTT